MIGAQAPVARVPLADGTLVATAHMPDADMIPHMDVTGGVGAGSVIEAVGMAQSMEQAMGVCRPGGTIGYVGVPHGVSFDGQQ